MASVAGAQPAGTTFRDCAECPEMVVVPEGRFEMGSTSVEGEYDEDLVHPVTIGYRLAVGVYEVTFAEWDACVSGGGCGGYLPSDRGGGRGRRPVINVSWNDAQAYVRWLSRETGETYRLLSEAEWEYVARAGTTTAYWWGNDIGRNRANCQGCGSRWDDRQTAPVGSFSENPFGLHDVHGNVWEWVEDCRIYSYRGAPSDGSAWTSGECVRRVLRGGSRSSFPRFLRSANRHGDTPGERFGRIGFRVARTLTQGKPQPIVDARGDPEDEVSPVVTPTPPSPEAVEQDLKLSREERRRVQMALAAAGHDPGPADGWIGAGTREAIRRWQEAQGRPATGYLDADGAKALLASGRREAERLQAEARRKRAQEPRDTFRDCPGCPEMVVAPEGSFRMGSPGSESGRDDDEGPVRRVTIGYRLAVGVHEVTRGEFARFVEATGRSMGNACWTYEGGEWEERSGRHWRNPGFRQTDEHPVVCVDWNDAQAYVRWLSGETGEEYRLLSEAEWEYVARAGTTGKYHFGASLSLSQAHYGRNRVGTVPVGSYSANPFGLHDVLGNVWEWTEDCWNDSYAGAPRDGSAWMSGYCGRRVLRGGSWVSIPRDLRSAARNWNTTGYRNVNNGFRVARMLTP